jgi:uncharacterized membrane protein (DUF373 family)
MEDEMTTDKQQDKNKSFISLTQGLENAEIYIYLATAFILVAASAGFLLVALYETAQWIAEGKFTRALLHLLDRALLVLMLAEIIYTVGRVARKLSLEVEPFLIVGVIAAVRRMLVITAESISHFKFNDPIFQAAMIELGLLALIVLIFVISMRLLRMKGTESH